MLLKEVTGLGYRESIRKNDVRHKYADDYWADECSGDVESPAGWFARYGRRVMFEDSQGFVSVTRFADESDATTAYHELEDVYSAWLGDDES